MRGAETREPEDSWIPVLPLDDLPPNKPRRVATDDLDLLLYRTAGEVLAVANQCTHQGAPLHKGVVKAGMLKTVTCAAHGSMFGLEDGRVLRGPATARLPVYDVRITGEVLEVRERPREQFRAPESS
jgi:nitrite reductase/ring-hydroxylating ferredoxin subunit